MNELYRVCNISKQAVHQYQNRQKLFSQKMQALIAEVDELKSVHPGCGVEKMYRTLQPDFIGRDKFVESFMALGYKLIRHRNYIKTTEPTCYQYPNLIEGIILNNVNQVWQSDITFIYIGGRFYYLIFIIDVYSKRIVGFKASDHMRAQANLEALQQAMKCRNNQINGLIHHSDRGSQYGANKYTNYLTNRNVLISMCASAQENAYAERVNGTIKNEYLKHWKINTLNSLRRSLTKAVKHYNENRIHDHLPDNLSPNKFEQARIKYPGRYTIIHCQDRMEHLDRSRYIWKRLSCPLNMNTIIN